MSVIPWDLVMMGGYWKIINDGGTLVYLREKNPSCISTPGEKSLLIHDVTQIDKPCCIITSTYKCGMLLSINQ